MYNEYCSVLSKPKLEQKNRLTTTNLGKVETNKKRKKERKKGRWYFENFYCFSPYFFSLNDPTLTYTHLPPSHSKIFEYLSKPSFTSTTIPLPTPTYPTHFFYFFFFTLVRGWILVWRLSIPIRLNYSLFHPSIFSPNPL